MSQGAHDAANVTDSLRPTSSLRPSAILAFDNVLLRTTVHFAVMIA